MSLRARKPIFALFATAVCLASIVGAASADDIVLQPASSASNDTFVYQFLPTFNFFHPSPFGAYLAADNTQDGFNDGHNSDTLISFDLSSVTSSLPAGQQIASASLRFYALSGEATSVNFGADPTAAAPLPYHVQALSMSFAASTATYNDLPRLTNGSPPVSTVVGTQTGVNQWVSLNVADQVNAWLNGSLPNYGLAITADNVDIDGQPEAGIFYSAFGAISAGSASLAPELVLTMSGPTFTWTSTGSNLWNSAGNWTNGSGLAGPPGLVTRADNIDVATFSGSGTTSIDLSGVNPSLSAINLSGSNYTLNGGTLTLKNDGETASAAVGGGSQTINSQVVLADDTLFSLAGQPHLTISGDIIGTGTLSLTGTGTLILSSSVNAFIGGIEVASGTLIMTNPGAAPDGASLTVGSAAALAFASNAPAAAVPASAEAVPEPAAVSLTAFTIFLLAAWKCGVKCPWRHAPSLFAARSRRFT